MTDFHVSLPKLRLIDTTPIQYEGASYLLLRDPLGLSENTLLVPQPMIPLLALSDGTRSPSTLRAALAIRYGLFLTPQRIEEFLHALDDALLLENERARQARRIAQDEFRQAAFRQPASAGASYPADPQELTEYLHSYLSKVNGHTSEDGAPSGQNGRSALRGIISPHIDYERGGTVYAQVWSQAAEAVQKADLAIIFGTDHFSEGYPISLTRQNYATPFGLLPTDTKIVDALAEVIGEEAAFAGELHHRREHSIELAAVWMHYLRNKRPIPMVPILTGSLSHPGQDGRAQELEPLLDVLRPIIKTRNTVVIAAGDLAHVGPAFDTEPVDPGKLILLKQSDDELIEAMCAGSAERFFGAIQRVQDQNNVCGVSPIYLTLRLLAPLKGARHGYAVCPADQANTSVVTICGVTLE